MPKDPEGLRGIIRWWIGEGERELGAIKDIDIARKAYGVLHADVFK